MSKQANIQVKSDVRSYTVEIPKGLVEAFIQDFSKQFTIMSCVDGGAPTKGVDNITPGREVFYVEVSVYTDQIDDFFAFVHRFAKEKGVGSKQ